MNCDKCSTSDADLFVGKLTANSASRLYDLSFGPDKVRDWGKEVEELREVARQLWTACLRDLVKRLATETKGKQFRDTLFEVLVAWHLLRSGATLRYHPSEYGSNPAEFLLHIADHRALIECDHQSADWLKVIEGVVRTKLKDSTGIHVLLWVPEVLDPGDGDLIEKRLAAEVLERAEQLQAGSVFEGKLVGGRVGARMRRTSGSEQCSVEWDRDQWNWQDPTGLDHRRVLALWEKALRKFDGLKQGHASDALRLIVLGCEGPSTHRRWTRTLIQEFVRSDAMGAAARQYLDAVVLAWCTNSRLVEQLEFLEPIVSTEDARRQARLRDFLERLGICARPGECETVPS